MSGTITSSLLVPTLPSSTFSSITWSMTDEKKWNAFRNTHKDVCILGYNISVYAPPPPPPHPQGPLLNPTLFKKIYVNNTLYAIHFLSLLSCWLWENSNRQIHTFTTAKTSTTLLILVWSSHTLASSEAIWWGKTKKLL